MTGPIRVSLHITLGELSDRVVADGYLALENGAELLKGASQALTPVESGRLRNEQDVRPDGENGFDVYVPGPYARFQEYGPDFNPETLHHEEGQSPYLSAAAEAEGPAILQLIAARIREAGGFQ